MSTTIESVGQRALEERALDLLRHGGPVEPLSPPGQELMVEQVLLQADAAPRLRQWPAMVAAACLLLATGVGAWILWVRVQKLCAHSYMLARCDRLPLVTACFP